MRWLSVILLSVASSLPAQTRTVAERLGYPRDAKLLILHADDLGFTHSADAASFDALDKGVISSASIMMPTPWITEVAAYARAHPDADLAHLTLTPNGRPIVGQRHPGTRFQPPRPRWHFPERR
jgi:predicted glycoside hydrolase/deacetylase ChbG (UPF0249 family)